MSATFTADARIVLSIPDLLAWAHAKQEYEGYRDDSALWFVVRVATVSDEDLERLRTLVVTSKDEYLQERLTDDLRGAEETANDQLGLTPAEREAALARHRRGRVRGTGARRSRGHEPREATRVPWVSAA